MPDPTARIESAIAALGSEHDPPDGWQERVTSAIAPAYYRARLVELERQCREDDGRMTRAPWQPSVWYGADEGGWAAVGPHHQECDRETCDHAPDGCGDHEAAERDAAGIARARNSLGPIADALAAAVARVDALEAQVSGLQVDLQAMEQRGDHAIERCRQLEAALARLRATGSAP